MTIVTIGRKEETMHLEFEFAAPMDAFVFFSMAKDSYREDDMKITMVEEGGNSENQA